jgi:LytS/YehU family sensor histidine kinase
MLTIDTFSLFIMICILAPLIGAFTLLFFIIFEKRINLLENQKREIALERELQTALYNQLNQEIQPHFFFNTLNSILSLARLDRKAELIRSIETLSKLMKFKYQTNKPVITIVDELRYTKYYLEIQKIRFREGLHYTISIDQRVEQAVTIPFLIQTFVENAFKHSFEKYIGDAYLNINVEKKETEVQVSVWNSSNEVYLKHTDISGLGLENIAKRLELLFSPENTAVKLDNIENGTRVTAVFPFKQNLS